MLFFFWECECCAFLLIDEYVDRLCEWGILCCEDAWIGVKHELATLWAIVSMPWHRHSLVFLWGFKIAWVIYESFVERQIKFHVHISLLWPYAKKWSWWFWWLNCLRASKKLNWGCWWVPDWTHIWALIGAKSCPQCIFYLWN